MRTAYIIFTLGWSGTILFFMLTPGTGEDSWLSFIPHIDKLVHFGLFCILSILTQNSIKEFSHSPLSTILISLAYGLSLGVLTEYLQAGIPGRNSDIFDLLADACGTFFGIFVIRYVKMP